MSSGKNNTKLYLYGLIVASIAPFLWLAGQGQYFGSPAYALANSLGLAGSVLLVWQFIIRNRAFSRLFGDDYLAINEVHKLVGTWGVLLIFMHPLLQSSRYSESLFWTFAVDFSGSEFERLVSFGRLAFIVLLSVWLLSVFFRKILPYRFWRRSHLLAYIILPLVILHAPNLGTFLSTYPWVRVYWWAFMGLWIGLILWRIMNFFNVGKSRYKLIDKKSLPGGITQYYLEPRGKQLRSKPGQFIYVRGRFFSEVHPFSVMEYDDSSGAITFGIKQVGKYTRQLVGIHLGATVYLDGPYGVFTREGHNDEPKVIIAGGIGITPFVELIRRFGGSNTYLIYANRSLDVAVKRREFLRELKANYKDVISDDRTNKEPMIHGKLDKKILQKTLPASSLKSSRFFLCGPPQFMSAVQASLQQLGVDKSRIYSEEFSL